MNGDPNIFPVVFVELCPEKCFVSATKSTAQAFGFTDVKQAIHRMSDSIKSRARGDGIKVVAEGLALLEWGEGKGVKNLAGFLLDRIGHDDRRSYLPDDFILSDRKSSKFGKFMSLLAARCNLKP